MEDFEQETKNVIRLRLIGIIMLLFFLLIVGMFGFHTLEGWSYKDSLYFSAISLMTRGQSNLYPTTFTSVLFTVFYLIIGVGFIIYAITNLLNYYITFYQKSLENKTLKLLNTLKKKQQPKKEKWIILKNKNY